MARLCLLELSAQRQAVASLCALGVVAFSALTGVTLPVAATSPVSKGLAQDVRELSLQADVPGVIALEFDASGQISSGVTGTDGNGDAITPDSVFVWGSISKSIAALVVWELSRKGRIELDSAVVDILPELKVVHLDPTASVRDLVNHMSGLPHGTTITDDWARRSSASDSLVQLRDVPDVRPRGAYRYSSLNYMVLQAVVERVTKDSYGQVLNEVMAERMGLADIIATPEAFENRVPPGHRPFFFSNQKVHVGSDTAGWGYGYLAGSATQLAQIGTWQLNDYRSGSVELTERIKPCSPLPDVRCHAAGLVHETVTASSDKAVTLIRHSGAVPGYYSHIAFSPERNRGVVLLANKYGELQAQTLHSQMERLVQRRVLGVEYDVTRGETYGYAIGGGLLVNCVLLLGFGFVVRRTMRAGQEVGYGKEVRHSKRASSRLAVAVVLGLSSVVGLLVGVPAALSLPHQVLYRWAPDVSILIWCFFALILAFATVLAISALRLRCSRCLQSVS